MIEKDASFERVINGLGGGGGGEGRVVPHDGDDGS